MDDIDKKIIEILKRDSRQRNVDIAKEIGTSEGTIRWRLKKLIEEKTIRSFTILTSEDNLNRAIVMLKARGEPKKLMKELSESGIAENVYEISGEFDGCAIIAGRSIVEIDEKIDKIRRLKNILDTQTYISFRKW